MTVVQEAAAALLLVATAPLATWAERRVKAWTQLRRGPGPFQVYRDLRRLWAKQPMMPSGASPFYALAPSVAFGLVLAALLVLPLYETGAGVGGAYAILVLGVVLTLHRVLLVAQAYDTATPFGGLGASRELFLGGLAEPVLLLAAAAVWLQSGTAGVPTSPLDAAEPQTWLLLASLAFLWLAEAARIPFDNPATHLELTMVHEALVLEASGWMLALHEAGAMVKQVTLSVLLIVLVVPLPASGPVRVAGLVAGAILLSGVFALAEAGMAKVRLFRASHLLIVAALVAFLAGAVGYLRGVVA